mgnify:CR=1
MKKKIKKNRDHTSLGHNDQNGDEDPTMRAITKQHYEYHTENTFGDMVAGIT